MQPVIVTYHDIFGIWDSVQEPIEKGLENLEIQWSDKISPSAITLDLQLRPLHQSQTDSIQGGLLEKPALNLLLVKCEDVEVYKARVRQLIRDWHNAISAYKHQEWLILLVMQTEPQFGGSQRASGAKFLGLKNSVYDKIKTDFNAARSDRCVQIKLGDARIELEEAYNDLFKKIKDGVSVSLMAKVKAYEEDIEKMSAQKHVPGWNFCSYFTLKERLAIIFQSMSLFHSSLQLYDELEETFYSFVNDRHVNHFSGQGGFGLGDDAGSFFDVEKKGYRDKILQQNISVFDLRNYIFIRQCQLLRHSSNYHDILSRAPSFITSQMRLLGPRKEFRQNFAESWAINALHSVLGSIPENTYNQSLAGMLGDCKCIQRDAYVRIGLQLQLLDPQHSFLLPASFESSKKSGEPSKENWTFGDPNMAKHVSSRNQMLAKLKNLTESILVDYKFSGRQHSSAQMISDMARMALFEDDFEGAARLLEPVMDLTSPKAWNHPSQDLLRLYMTALKKAGNISKYIETCLDLLKQTKLATPSSFYTEEFQTCAKASDLDITRAFGDYFQCTIARHVDSAEDTPGWSLSAEIDSMFPAQLHIDEISLKLIDKMDRSWKFSNTTSKLLNPGLSSFKLFSNEMLCGSWTLAEISLILGGIKFSQTCSAEISQQLVTRPRKRAILQTASNIQLDQRRTLECEIRFGSHEFSSCEIELSAVTSGIDIAYNQAECFDEAVSLIYCRERCFRIMNPPVDSSITIAVPYQTEQPLSIIELDVTILSRHDAVEYLFTDTIRTDVLLLLAVNVQDFFRSSKLLSKYQISCSGRLSVNFVGIDLLDSQGFDVTNSSHQQIEDGIIINPGMSMVQVYEIRPKKSREDVSNSMRLVLRFFSILEQLRLHSHDSLRDSSKRHPVSDLTEGVLENEIDNCLTMSDVAASLVSGILEFSKILQGISDKVMPLIKPGDRHHADKIISNLLQMHVPTENLSNGRLLSIEIPVDVFERLTVCAASVKVCEPTLFVGVLCSAVLTISSSQFDGSDPRGQFYYELETDNATWLIVGPRRASFSAAAAPLETSIQLIPMKTGYLPLPGLEVKSQVPGVVCETHLVTANTHILVVDTQERRTINL